jgi:ELWxxDGT repeat protein
VWRTDGTAAGTVLIADIESGAAGSDPTNFIDTYAGLYFSASAGGAGRELWRTNGSAASTIRVGDSAPGAASSDPTPLGVAGTKLFLSATDLGPRRVWVPAAFR